MDIESIKLLFKEVHEILEDEGGAHPAYQLEFVEYHEERHNPLSLGCEELTEWRFMGKFGAGGKFLSNTRHFKVVFDSEDFTQERELAQSKINELLKPLHQAWMFLVDKHEDERRCKAYHEDYGRCRRDRHVDDFNHVGEHGYTW